MTIHTRLQHDNQLISFTGYKMDEVLQFVIDFLYLIYLWVKAIVIVFIPKSFRYKDMEDEMVLITGGGSGIGRLLALRFARLGSRVVVWDVNKEGNDETAEIVRGEGGECRSYVCDVSNRSDVYATARKVKDEMGCVTMLINNAGIVTGKPFMDCPDEKIEKTFQVNSLAHFWTCKAFLPDMMATNHGHIITISSVIGLIGAVGVSDYSASKFATVGFHESLNLELRKHKYNGIKMTLVCPFHMKTGMFQGVDTGYVDGMEPEYAADEIVSAIRAEEEMFIFPFVLRMSYTLKGILPVSVASHLYSMLKGNEVMDNFIGRSQK